MIKETFVESIAINQNKSSGKQIKSAKKGVFGAIFNAQKNADIQSKKKEIDGLLASLKTGKNSSHMEKTLNELEKLLENLSNGKQQKNRSAVKKMHDISDLIKKIKVLLQDKKSDEAPIKPKNGIKKSIAESNKHGNDNLKQAISYLINVSIDTQQKLNKENRSDKDTSKKSGKSNKIAAGSKDAGRLIKLKNDRLNIIKPSNIDKKVKNHKATDIKQKNVKAKEGKFFSAAEKTDNKTDIVSNNTKKDLKTQKPLNTALNNAQKKIDIESKNSISSLADKNKILNETKQHNGVFSNSAKIVNLAKDSANAEFKHHLNGAQDHKNSKKGSVSADIEESSKIKNGKVVDIKKIKTDGNVKIIKNAVSNTVHENRQNSNINNVAKIDMPINMPQENRKTAAKPFISAKIFKTKGIKNEGFFEIGTNNNIEKIKIKDMPGIKISDKDNADYKDAQKIVNTGFSAAINNTEQISAKQHPYPINKVIDEISKLQNLQPPFNKTITIKINPPYLGVIQIKVSMDKDKNLSTVISAKDKSVLNILNLHAGYMKEYLTNNGIKMQDINIFNNLTQNGEQHSNQNQFSFGSGNNPQGQNQRFSQNDEMEFLKTENLKNITQTVHREKLNIIV